MTSPYILTHTGAKLYADADRPDFRVIDIAHGLSMRCRWNGQCRVFYPVAQHGVLCAEIAQKLGWADPFECLHHDDTEAYFPDMPTPWKRILPDFSAMEKNLERKNREWLGLPAEMTEGCRNVDGVALLVEARCLMPDNGADIWGLPYFDHLKPYAAAWPDITNFLSPLGARCSYLFTHDKLLRKRK